MPQFMSVEVSAEMVADLMSDDPNFAAEMWAEIAERVSAGAMRDDAADVCAGMEISDARRISASMIDLGQAMRDGFNMAHHDQSI